MSRKKLDLTQGELGKLVGVTDSAISNVETGKAELSNTLALAIEYKTGISKKWLFTGKGKMFVKTNEQLAKELAQTKKAVSDLEVDLANLPERHKKIIADMIAELQRA